METIASRLNKALSLRKMKPIELAEKTGIDKGSISSYLSGRYKPKSKNIYIMAKILDISPTWLLGYDVDINNDEIINIYKDDQIVLWRDLFGYKQGDKISFDIFCEFLSLFYNSYLGMTEFGISFIPEIIKRLKTNKESTDKTLIEVLTLMEENSKNFKKILNQIEKKKEIEIKVIQEKLETMDIIKETDELLDMLYNSKKISRNKYNCEKKKLKGEINATLAANKSSKKCFNIVINK